MKFSEAIKIKTLYFLVFCNTAAWLPLFADFCKDRGMSGMQTGIMISIVPFMMLLVQPVYGMLADSKGYKKTFVLSSLAATVSYALYLPGNSFAYLFAVTVMMAISYNALLPLLDSLSLRLVQADPKFSYGTLRIAGAAGWAFTGILTGQLIDAINTRVIFVVAAVSMLLATIMAAFLKPDDKSVKEAGHHSLKTARSLLVDKRLVFFLIGVFLISVGTSTIWYFYSIYMKENGASASLVGYGLSFQGLCELPLFYFSARIIARLGIKTTLLVTVMATVIRMLLYATIKNPHVAIFIEVLQGISWSLFWVVSVEYVNKIVLEEWRATGQSLLSAAYYGAGYIAGNLWTGYLHDTKIKIADVFFLNAGIVLLAGLFIWIFMARERDKIRLQQDR